MWSLGWPWPGLDGNRVQVDGFRRRCKRKSYILKEAIVLFLKCGPTQDPQGYLSYHKRNLKSGVVGSLRSLVVLAKGRDTK